MPSADTSIALIAQSPALVDECLAVLPAFINAELRPASEAEIMEALGRRFALFPQPDRSDAEWSAWWGEYFDALDGLSLLSLEAGMRAWVREPDAEFMPKPGRLRELAKTAPVMESKICYRMKSVVRAYEQAQAIARTERCRLENLEPVEPTPEEIADDLAKKQMVAEYLVESRQRRREREAAKPKANFQQGRVDHTGITAELRAIMESQRAPQ